MGAEQLHGQGAVGAEPHQPGPEGCVILDPSHFVISFCRLPRIRALIVLGMDVVCSAGQDKGVRLIVAGCVPQGQPSHGRLADVSMVGVSQIDRIAEVAEAALQGEFLRMCQMGLTCRSRQNASRGASDLSVRI